MRFPLLSALLLGVAVSAQVKVGAEAPELSFDSRFNFGDLPAQRLGQLRGSAVLLTFWAADSKASIGQVECLNALHEKRYPEGLVVVGVTSDENKEVTKFIAAQKVTYPIAIGWNQAWAVRMIPSALLIDPDGKVLWTGLPTELDEPTLAQALANARPATYAKGLEGVAKKLGAKDFGGAFAECKKLLTDGKLSAEAQAQAEKLCTEIEGKAATLVDHGIDRLAAGDPFAAFEAFDAVARGYAKVPRAEEATGKLQELAKDPKLKREIAAGQKLSAAQKFDQNRDYDKAHKEYKAIASTFSGTKAAKIAAEAASVIEKNGRLGYLRGCGACDAANAACPAHKKKR